MKAKKTITELRKAGWAVDEVHTQKQHYICAGTENMGSRPKAVSYVATLPGCHYRLEFFVSLAKSVEEHDEHSDIQVLHKDEPSNAVGCTRAKTVKRAIAAALEYSAGIDEQKARRHSMDALFDGSDAHRLVTYTPL